jgi:hypothetical protein
MKASIIIQGILVISVGVSVLGLFTGGLYDSFYCDRQLYVKEDYSTGIGKLIWTRNPTGPDWCSSTYYLVIINGEKIIKTGCDSRLYPTNRQVKLNTYYYARFCNTHKYCFTVNWADGVVSDSVLQDYLSKNGLTESDYNVPDSIIAAFNAKGYKGLSYYDKVANAHGINLRGGQEGPIKSYLRKLFWKD